MFLAETLREPHTAESHSDRKLSVCEAGPPSLLSLWLAALYSHTHMGRKWRTKADRNRDGIKPDISVPEETDASGKRAL